MKTIILTGAGGSAGANFLDALKQSDFAADIAVVGVDLSSFRLANVDGLGARYIVPRVSSADYGPALNRLIERHNVDLIHPQPDPEVAAIAFIRAYLKTKVFLPQTATITTCQDKGLCLDKLDAAGVPVGFSSITYDERTVRQAARIAISRSGQAWVRARRGAGSRAALPAQTADEAFLWIQHWVRRGSLFSDFLVAEFLTGSEFGWTSLWKDGKLIVSATRQRLEYLFGYLTPSGQTSSPALAKTVHRRDVNEIAERAVSTIDPFATGVFCVDLKEDIDGRPCVTEINAGRFFTTTNFFAHAGLNFPELYLRLAFGLPMPTLPKYNAVRQDLYWVRTMDVGWRLFDRPPDIPHA